MISVQTQSGGVIERYLEFLAAHDWDGLATTIADKGLVREGPFCDVVEGKEHYVAYLRKVLTTLKGHRLDVSAGLTRRQPRLVRRADRIL